MAVRAAGGTAIKATCETPDNLMKRNDISGAIWWGDAETARAYDIALANAAGPILPLITGRPDPAHCQHERHVCIDTTASGGNATLLAAVASEA